ncbi:Glycoside hydrolase, partial [Parasponia andersonii]
IRPFVTILHFDTPQALEDKYGGFLSRSIVKDFTDYCEILFRTYGDRVKDWITINEPFVVALGYDIGNAAPGRCSLPPPLGPCPAGNSSTEPYIVAHNFILSHASAVKLYKEKFQAEQGGQIGITLLTEFIVPYDPNSLEDKEASERYMDFLLGWFMEPFVYGRYPGIMSELVKERLPTFSEEDKKLIHGAYDFIGINYYTSKYAKKPNHPPFLLHYVADQLTLKTESQSVPRQSEGSGYVYSYPQGLQELLEFMKRKYHNPPIYITENGIPEETVPDRTLDEALTDPYRIKFILQHLYYIKAALMNGVNVKGYFYWSVFDNFEWNGGYAVRYGLYYIDYKDNLKRIPKLSAKWFGGFLNGHTSTAPSQCTAHHKIDL